MTHKILCGTPQEHCTGGRLVTDQHFSTSKCHTDRQQAFRCYCRYLQNVLGYKRISMREYQDPKSGYITMLPKQSHFGGYLRTGKKQARWMPKKRFGRGLIV